MTDEVVKELLKEMDLDGWGFLTSCYNGAKLETAAVKSAYQVQLFLEKFHAHPLVKAAKEANAPAS